MAGGAAWESSAGPPPPPPPEGPGPGRRRWTPQPQPQPQPRCHAAFSPAAGSPAEACPRASLVLPARRQQQQPQPQPQGPRRIPLLGMGARSRRRPGWRWRCLAAGLGCCALLALYASCALSSSSASRASLPSLLRGPLRPERGEGQHQQEEAEAEAEGSPVTVLLWWEPFGRSRRLGDCQGRFGIPSCRLTTDRSQLPRAQAVLFHHRDLALHGPLQLPPERPPSQRWVWMNFESPSHSRGLRGLRGLFNWTMSYKVDSDVFVPYGYLRPARGPPPALPSKTKLVAWVVSNWGEDQARVRYYRRLKDFLPIDLYGARGRELEAGNLVQTLSQYKFYLAFENSQHPDYITEKLWRNAFESWAVPVALGPPRANYELFVPSDAFIHVEDFPGPRQLARYLKFLDKNKARYRKYFAWRKHYDVQVTSFWDEHCCRVCDVVRASGKQPKTVQNLALWFES